MACHSINSTLLSVEAGGLIILCPWDPRIRVNKRQFKMLQLVPHDGHYYYLYRQLPATRNRSPTNVTRKLGLAWRFGEPIKRAQAGDAAHRSAAASSNGFEVEEGRGRRYTQFNFFSLFTFFSHLLSVGMGMQYCTQNPRKNIVCNFHISAERSIQRIWRSFSCWTNFAGSE